MSTLTAEERRRVEEAVRQLATQIDELRSYIEAVQNRLLAISSELEELRLALDTISSIDKYKQSEVFVSLDRRGYAYAKASLVSTTHVLVHIGQDLYAVLPIEKAREVLSSREKDLANALRETEAELKKLTEIHNQLQKKLQEYIAILSSQQQPQQAG